MSVSTVKECTMTEDTSATTADSFLVAMLTGLTHLNIVQRIKHLAYDLEMSSSEIKSMKHAYINNDDVPVVFYRMPDEFRQRLLMELPIDNIKLYADNIGLFSELPEDELESLISENFDNVFFEPIAQTYEAFRGYEVLHDESLPKQKHLDEGIFRVVKAPSGLDSYGDQEYSLAVLVTDYGRRYLKEQVETGNLSLDSLVAEAY